MYIYKITNNLNGNSYVGLKTSSVEESENYYGSGKLIQIAIEKHGKENFTKEILERDITDFDLLCLREKHFISLYNTKDKGYNMTDGGLGSHGYTQTEEHKNKIANTVRERYVRNPETISKISEAATKYNVGRPVSEETRRKISEAMKGRKHTATSKKKMRDAERSPRKKDK